MTTDIQGDCWDWRWAVNKKTGYGAIYTKENGVMTAPRYFYEGLVGQIPRGMFVCHHCDNRLCVNPKHLFLGTAKDNTQDMIRKGRKWIPPEGYQCGESHSQAKLTLKQVDEIRKRYSRGGITYKQLADEFNVSSPHIYSIVNAHVWHTGYKRIGYTRRGDTKLTQTQVDEIREKYAKGDTTQRKLAKEYGVVHSQIGNVVRRKHWNYGGGVRK